MPEPLQVLQPWVPTTVALSRLLPGHAKSPMAHPDVVNAPRGPLLLLGCEQG